MFFLFLKSLKRFSLHSKLLRTHEALNYSSPSHIYGILLPYKLISLPGLVFW